MEPESPSDVVSGDEDKFIVRVMCNNKSLFVEFSESELDIKKFPEKVANIFGIKFGDDVHSGLILTDNLGFPIPRNMLAEIVKKFHNGMFYINVEYQISRHGHISVVTVPMLESFFRRQNQADLLNKKGVLDDRTRIQIVNCLVDFMIEAFGKGDPSNVTKQSKQLTARAAVCVFPGLKSDDPVNELSKLVGVGGYFVGRLKYLKSKRDELNAPNLDQVSNQLAAVQLSPESDLQFLQNCVVKHTDQNVIIAKLKSTRRLRDTMMRDENIDLRQSFSFFFTEPRLIVLDFEDNPNFKCDPNAFINNWPRYGLKVRDLVDKNIGTDWSQDIENLLLLLHMFPAKSCHLPMSEAIKKLIVFRVTGTPPEKMIENDNDHPYIVAYGTSKKDIISFYIEAERHLIPLPSEFGIAHAFDVYFKLHFVFGLSFDKALENIIIFIQRLIYDLRKGRASSASMQTFFEKLL